jgi:hypothetical protein
MKKKKQLISMKDKVDLVEVRVTHDYTAQEEEGNATFIVTSSIFTARKACYRTHFLWRRGRSSYDCEV